MEISDDLCMIEFNEVSKDFKTDFWAPKFKALVDVSFKVRPGSITGFLGANGAGKTTLLKILMGFIKPSSGQVSFADSLGTNLDQIFTKIGYLPERPYFYPYLKGREFLHYMGEIQDLNKSEIEESIEKWSTKLKVDYALDRFVRGYSKGMLQRLGFASVLLHNPDLIVLDEPLSGLDPVGRKEFKDILSGLHDGKKTIFFSSHIVSDVEEICDDVVVLEKGRSIFNGSIDELISNNTNNDVEIKIRGMNKVILPFEQRDEYISKALAEGKSIELVRETKPTLEEIVYKLK